MSAKTSIEWCDSTVNPVMGCDGCELWDAAGKARHCYAGTLHERYGGRTAGYAKKFLEPEPFPGRMAAAARWRDLTGTKRPDKPWLDGRPRHVFISDMGDALSGDVPFAFLYNEVVRVARLWPHVGMWLTKQPQRMVEFAAWLVGRYLDCPGDPFAWPERLWVGASLTDPQRQRARVDALRQVPAATRFLSVEPLIADPGQIDLRGIALVIIGGESGPGARPCDVEWIRSVLRQCREAGVPAFVKQLGADVRWNGMQGGYLDGPSNVWPAGAVREEANHGWRVRLRDRKGGDPSEWPQDLRVREFPEVGR